MVLDIVLCRPRFISKATPNKMRTHLFSSSSQRANPSVTCQRRAFSSASFRSGILSCLSSQAYSATSSCRSCPHPRPPPFFNHATHCASPPRRAFLSVFFFSVLLLPYYYVSFHPSVLVAAAPASCLAISKALSFSFFFFFGGPTDVTANSHAAFPQTNADDTHSNIEEEVEEEEKEEERNNWAVIVSASRYWHNYRHTANALTIYFAVKRLGVPDSRIILMVADDHACSPRNPFPGQIFNSPRRSFNLYGVTAPSAAAVQARQKAFEEATAAGARNLRKEAGNHEEALDKHLQRINSFFRPSSSASAQHPSSSSSPFPPSAPLFPSASLSEDVEVDYRGEEVHVQALLRLLTGRHAPETPRGQRLLSDSRSHVLVYLTGHGGENFLKFQDWEEIGSVDLADAVAQMHQQQRYKRLLVIAETCQGSTLLDSLYSPNVLGLASSKLNESSYSHHADAALGVSVVDRWTYYTLRFFQKHIFRRRNASYFSPSAAARETGRGNASSRTKSRNNHHSVRGDNWGKQQQQHGDFGYSSEEEEEDMEEDTDELEDQEKEEDDDEEMEDTEGEDMGSTRDWRTVETRRHKRTEKGRGDERGRSGQKERRSKTIAELLKSYKFEKLMSTATARADLFDKLLEETTLDEFFSAATGVVIPTLRPCWLPRLQEEKGMQHHEHQQQGQQQQQVVQHQGESQQQQHQWQLDAQRHQRRSQNSYPIFNVLPYYRESFLCLACNDVGRASRASVLPPEVQQQQQEEGQQRVSWQLQGGRGERPEKSHVGGSAGRSCRVKAAAAAGGAADTADSTACSQEIHLSRGNNFNRNTMYTDESDYEGDKKRQQQRHEDRFHRFQGLLQAAAAGVAALLAAAATSSLL